MRNHILTLALSLSLLGAACGGASTTVQTSQNTNTNSGATRPAAPAQGTANRELGATSSHGTGTPNSAAPAAGGGGGGDADRALVNTSEQDARIQKAAAKADAPGASEADKKAAAEAYLARGNVYRDAGNPRLYKFALGDYRRVLRYQPDNREAKEKMDEIVGIYEGMGRPVPTNGLEP